MNRMSGIDGARDIMPPKKLRLNPPKNPPQQPTPRIKFTNFNKDTAQVGITVDQEARRRQDELVQAASHGEIPKSTEATQHGAVTRNSPHRAAAAATTAAAAAAATPSGQHAPIENPEASIASVSKGASLPSDVRTVDAPAESEPTPKPSSRQPSMQRTPSAPVLPEAPPMSQPPPPTPVVPPPPPRPVYQPTSAFDRFVRDPGKGKAFATSNWRSRADLVQVLPTPCGRASWLRRTRTYATLIPGQCRSIPRGGKPSMESRSIFPLHICGYASLSGLAANVSVVTNTDRSWPETLNFCVQSNRLRGGY